jgi:hypothetical protein
LSTAIGNDDLEDPIQRLYCGLKKKKPSLVYTPFKILMMGILFSSGHMIMASFLFGWEEHNVMLGKMNIMYFSKW